MFRCICRIFWTKWSPTPPSPLPFFYKLNHLSLLRSPGEGSVCLRTRVAYKWSRNTRNTNHNSSFLGSKYWRSLPTTSPQTITLLTCSCINYDNNDVQMKQERTFLLASCILNMKVDSPLFPNIWLFSPDAPTSCVTPDWSSFEQHFKPPPAHALHIFSLNLTLPGRGKCFHFEIRNYDRNFGSNHYTEMPSQT